MKLTGHHASDTPPERCPKCLSEEYELIPNNKGGRYVLNGMVVRKCGECGALNADRLRMADLKRYGKLCW